MARSTSLTTLVYFSNGVMYGGIACKAPRCWHDKAVKRVVGAGLICLLTEFCCLVISCYTTFVITFVLLKFHTMSGLLKALSAYTSNSKIPQFPLASSICLLLHFYQPLSVLCNQNRIQRFLNHLF